MSYMESLGFSLIDTSLTPPSGGGLVSPLLKPAAKPATSSSGGFWDKVGSALKGGLNFYGESQANKGAADLARGAAAQPGGGGGTPSWLLPVGLGIAGIALVFVLTKKKGTP